MYKAKFALIWEKRRCVRFTLFPFIIEDDFFRVIVVALDVHVVFEVDRS